MIYIVGYLFTKLIQLALEIYEYIIWRDIRIDPTTKNLKLRTYTKGLLSVAEITLFIVILVLMFRPKFDEILIKNRIPIISLIERLECSCLAYDGLNYYIIYVSLICLAFFSVRASLYFLAYCCYFSIIGILYCTIKPKGEDEDMIIEEDYESYDEE